MPQFAVDQRFRGFAQSGSSHGHSMIRGLESCSVGTDNRVTVPTTTPSPNGVRL